MIGPCGIQQRNEGFTLLEVLISISIFAIVVSSVYGAYRATFQTVGTTEQQVTLAAAARVILERVSEDLGSLSTAGDGALLGQRGDIAGKRADGFSCISSAHLVFHRSAKSVGRAVLKYSVEENESGLMDLYRLDIPLVPGERDESLDAKGELLGQGLQEFRVTYVTADGNELEEWDSAPDMTSDSADNEKVKMILPVLVRLQIRFADSPESEVSTVFRTSVALPRLPEEESEG